MTEPLVIKRSPIVMIRNLIMFELVALIGYSWLAVLADYGKLYQTLSISQVASFDLVKFLGLMVAELFFTLYLFLRWFNENYVIGDQLITHERGVLRNQKRDFSFTPPIEATIQTSPFSRLFKYGSIVIKTATGETIITLRDIAQPERYVNLIMNRGSRHRAESRRRRNEAISLELTDAPALVRQSEHERLEKKATLRWDLRAKKVNPELEWAVMKTLAAFLNSSGGHLVIGVGDTGELTGLASDYQTLRRPNADGFEHHLTQLFNNMIGANSRRLIKIWFPPVAGVEVCVIAVAPSPRPVYVKGNNEEMFYVRTGNTTTPLKLSEVTAYIQSWWPTR